MSVSLRRRRIISEPVDRPPGPRIRPTASSSEALADARGHERLAPAADLIKTDSRRCRLHGTAALCLAESTLGRFSSINPRLGPEGLDFDRVRSPQAVKALPGSRPEPSRACSGGAGLRAGVPARHSSRVAPLAWPGAVEPEPEPSIASASTIATAATASTASAGKRKRGTRCRCAGAGCETLVDMRSPPGEWVDERSSRAPLERRRRSAGSLGS